MWSDGKDVGKTLEEEQFDRVLAFWSAGHSLNSKSNHLIMTCQGCELRQSREDELRRGMG